jgi:hypothetical protein
MTLATIPSELHLEILRRCDVPSLLSMKNVNHYFHDLIDGNRDALLQTIIRDVECVPPHSMLLLVPKDEESTPSDYANWIHSMRQDTLRIARICDITEDDKIDALYCLIYFQSKSVGLVDGIADDLPADEAIKLWFAEIQKVVFPLFTTAQIQSMLSIWIPIVFRIAGLMHVDFSGSSLSLSDYKRINGWLFSAGISLVAELEDHDIEDREDLIEEEELDMLTDDIPCMEEEFIKALETRGSGLIKEPARKIREFMKNYDTCLDMSWLWEEEETTEALAVCKLVEDAEPETRLEES